MSKSSEKWPELSEEFNFTQLSQFKYISSPDVPFVVIQFQLTDNSLDSTRRAMQESFKKDYLGQNGVYFLKLQDGYYIGESKNLNARIADHIKNRDIESVTLATYKAEEDAWNKDSIRDLESLLMKYAIETGMVLGASLKNAKYEERKLLNMLDMRRSEKSAKYIWDKITYLNIRDILDEAKSRLIFANGPAPEIETDSNVRNSKKRKAKKLETRRQGSAKDLRLAGITQKVDMTKRVKMNISSDPFLNLVPRSAAPATGYIRKSVDIFSKESAKKALFLYLYTGVSVNKTDFTLTNDRAVNGYITAVTLAYLGIKTNGEALGYLRELKENDCKELINKFVERNY